MANIDYEAIGRRIRIARLHKGFTQEKVAEYANVGVSHMSNIETAKTKVSLQTLIAIANALDVSVDKLLCDNVKASRTVFEQEIKELLDDCDEYELKFIIEVLKPLCSYYRNVKKRMREEMECTY